MFYSLLFLFLSFFLQVWFCQVVHSIVGCFYYRQHDALLAYIHCIAASIFVRNKRIHGSGCRAWHKMLDSRPCDDGDFCRDYDPSFCFPLPARSERPRRYSEVLHSYLRETGRIEFRGQKSHDCVHGSWLWFVFLFFVS